MLIEGPAQRGPSINVPDVLKLHFLCACNGTERFGDGRIAILERKESFEKKSVVVHLYLFLWYQKV